MSNPALKENSLSRFQAESGSFEVASVSGTVIKTFLLFSILVCSASYTYSLFFQNFLDKAMMLGTVGVIGAFIVSLVLIFARKLEWMAPLSILYSVLEGLALGGVSAIFAAKYGAGIVTQALLATFGSLLGMLFLYSTKIIRCTEKFMATMLVAMFGILIIYLTTFIIGLFNPSHTSVLMGNSPVGIGFSVVVCIVAALNFIIDFHMIEQACEMNFDKRFEWYSAFSLMLTIVWLYIEILKLLAKTSSRK